MFTRIACSLVLITSTVRCVAIVSPLGEEAGGIVASGDWDGRVQICECNLQQVSD